MMPYSSTEAATMARATAAQRAALGSRCVTIATFAALCDPCVAVAQYQVVLLAGAPPPPLPSSLHSSWSLSACPLILTLKPETSTEVGGGLTSIPRSLECACGSVASGRQAAAVVRPSRGHIGASGCRELRVAGLEVALVGIRSASSWGTHVVGDGGSRSD